MSVTTACPRCGLTNEQRAEYEGKCPMPYPDWQCPNTTSVPRSPTYDRTIPAQVQPCL